MKTIENAELFEISLVLEAANPHCKITAIGFKEK